MFSLIAWEYGVIYTTCKFIYVRYGTGYNFPHWSPTLSGLMLVLSVPVLTRSPSRLQFLLAIATRLPFWLGPADLKCRVTLFGLDQPSEYHWNFQNVPWPSGAACVLLEHTRERAQTLTTKRPHNGSTYMANLFFTKQICTEQHCLLGITSDVIFVGGVDFFYSSVAEGQFSHPVHASSHACGQTEIGTGRCCVETVSAEVICTEMKTKEERMSTRCTKNWC